jgi:hypothetical protein
MAKMPDLKPQPTPQAVVDEHLDALNRGDWNRLMAQYPDDVEIFLPGGVVIRGREAVGEAFADLVKPFKDGGLLGVIFTPEQAFHRGQHRERAMENRRRILEGAIPRSRRVCDAEWTAGSTGEHVRYASTHTQSKNLAARFPMPDRNKILDEFFGDATTPIQWKDEEEKKLHFWLDDLHCPQPISPMWFDIGGWWLTCGYMYRRFGVPFGKDWVAKTVNGYLMSAVVPRPADEEAGLWAYYNMVMPVYADKFLDWWKRRYLPEILRNFEYLDTFPMDTASLPELMILLKRPSTSRSVTGGCTGCSTSRSSRPRLPSRAPSFR